MSDDIIVDIIKFVMTLGMVIIAGSILFGSIFIQSDNTTIPQAEEVSNITTPAVIEQPHDANIPRNLTERKAAWAAKADRMKKERLS
jgi:hypothetical protein